MLSKYPATWGTATLFHSKSLPVSSRFIKKTTCKLNYPIRYRRITKYKILEPDFIKKIIFQKMISKLYCLEIFEFYNYIAYIVILEAIELFFEKPQLEA